MLRFHHSGFNWHLLACGVFAACLGIFPFAHAGDEPPAVDGVAPFDAFPAWRTMDGLWRGELDSYGPEGDHKIRGYNALFRIDINGNDFHLTNWMYYGSQHVRGAQLSQGLAREGEGVELITSTYGHSVDENGSMKVSLIDHMFDSVGGELIRVVSDFAVLYEYFNPESGALQHLQLNNLGVPDVRMRSAQGIHANEFLIDPMTGEKRLDAEGDPIPDPQFQTARSASFYREVRVDEADLHFHRADFQGQYNVKVRVEAGATPDAPSRVYRSDAEIDECDWLANHPYDSWRVTSGIAQEDVNTDLAFPACVDAAASRPEEPRFQAGRALFYAGRVPEALPYLKRAAIEMDYPQAQYVLGYLKDVGLGGVPVDTCEAGLLWRRAAHQELFYAEYSIGKGLLEERYIYCPWHSAHNEALGFLKSAHAKSACTVMEEELAELIGLAGATAKP